MASSDNNMTDKGKGNGNGKPRLGIVNTNANDTADTLRHKLESLNLPSSHLLDLLLDITLKNDDARKQLLHNINTLQQQVNTNTSKRVTTSEVNADIEVETKSNINIKLSRGASYDKIDDLAISGSAVLSRKNGKYGSIIHYSPTLTVTNSFILIFTIV